MTEFDQKSLAKLLSTCDLDDYIVNPDLLREMGLLELYDEMKKKLDGIFKNAWRVPQITGEDGRKTYERLMGWLKWQEGDFIEQELEGERTHYYRSGVMFYECVEWSEVRVSNELKKLMEKVYS